MAMCLTIHSNLFSFYVFINKKAPHLLNKEIKRKAWGYSMALEYYYYTNIIAGYPCHFV